MLLFMCLTCPKLSQFYETAFDLKRRFIHESHLYAEMETGSTALAFAGNEAAEMAGLRLLPNDPKAVAAGWEICLITDDVAKAYDHAISKGCRPGCASDGKTLGPDGVLSARFERLPC